MRVRLLFLFFLFLFFSCNNIKSPENDFKVIKYLEYTRNPDTELWQKYDTPENRYQLIESIGKTRNSNLLPILSQYLSRNPADSLLCSVVFSIGQIGTDDAFKLLLQYPDNKSDFAGKRCIINSVAFTKSPDISKYFLNLFTEPDLKSNILTASGILAKNNINTFAIKQTVWDSVSIKNPTAELSYYLSNTININDVSKAIGTLLNSSGQSQKYLLKGFVQINKADNKKLFYNIKNDSLSRNILYTVLSGVINSTIDWTSKYYALQLVPLVSDSMLNSDVLKLCKSEQIHVKLTALHAFAQTGDDAALSTLLSSLENENQWYVKGAIIKILAEFFPNKAYPFIMQNLDKGDLIFKSELLEALAILNTKLSIRTLQQFLNVDEPILVNTTFEQLNNLHLIREYDIESLLESDNFSTVASVLNYLNNQGKKTDVRTLLDLYKKFRFPSEFEVQFAIIESFKNNMVNADSLVYTELIKYACHDVVLRKLKDQFGMEAPEIFRDVIPGFQLPSHLQPDSIQYYSENPKLEITTSKGNIQIELFSKIAPFTVFNFIRLIDMNFYNDLTFHRVVPDFVIQGGDPQGDGWGGPNFFIPSEHSRIPFKRGSIGIATSGFDTGSSQFFICQSEQPHLNGRYTLFGKVTAGMDIVDSILPGDLIIGIKPLN